MGYAKNWYCQGEDFNLSKPYTNDEVASIIFGSIICATLAIPMVVGIDKFVLWTITIWFAGIVFGSGMMLSGYIKRLLSKPNFEDAFLLIPITGCVWFGYYMFGESALVKSGNVGLALSFFGFIIGLFSKTPEKR